MDGVMLYGVREFGSRKIHVHLYSESDYLHECKMSLLVRTISLFSSQMLSPFSYHTCSDFSVLP